MKMETPQPKLSIATFHEHEIKTYISIRSIITVFRSDKTRPYRNKSYSSLM